MGCCQTSPSKAPADEDAVYLDPDVDPEESEHAGHVHSVARPLLSSSSNAPAAAAAAGSAGPGPATSEGGGEKVKVSENHHFKVFDRRLTPVVEEPASEKSVVMQRISQSAASSRKLSFFSHAYRGDPFKIAVFLSDVDLARLSQVNRQLHSVVEGHLSLRHAKKLARPDYSPRDWSKLGMATRGLGLAWTKLKRQLLREEKNQNIAEEQADGLTVHIFKEKYEARRVPVLVRGCASEWKAFATPSVWTLDSLVTRFGECLFRFNDLHGEEILLKDYLTYARSTDDDSPLGLYDSQIGVEPGDPREELLREYSPPAFFGEDLFAIMDHPNNNASPAPANGPDGEEAEEESRPPHRWILIGTPRSGTEMHVDPLETSAWVTLLSGKKKWVMFPPGTDQKNIGGVHRAVRREHSRGSSIEDIVYDGAEADDGRNGHERTPTACEWFSTYWGTPATHIKGTVSLIQGPGDTVFIPGGWPHIVINLEETVAITHNYAPRESLSRIRAVVAENEPKFSKRWERELKARGIL